MTQRQRRYWREQYKFANYCAVLKAVKGPDYSEPIIPEKFHGHLESMTTYLSDKNHEMYLILKSLGALKKSANIKENGYLSKDELDAILLDVKDIDETATEGRAGESDDSESD